MDALLTMICTTNRTEGCINQLSLLDISNTDITREGFIKLMTTIDTTNITLLHMSNLLLKKMELM